MGAEVNWKCLPFEGLSGELVYAILELRAAVFVVEQECAYLDPDGLDRQAYHHLGRRDGRLIAYQRCLPPGVAHDGASAIGRIVVAPEGRGGGLGRELVERAIAFNFAQWPQHDIVIGAQCYLQPFYESLGFAACSEPYLEDGIPHIDMRLGVAASKAGT